jgi:hypothetical protein
MIVIGVALWQWGGVKFALIQSIPLLLPEAIFVIIIVFFVPIIAVPNMFWVAAKLDKGKIGQINNLKSELESIENKIKDPPELIKLADMRKSGISLRNRGFHASTEREVIQWVEKFEIWDTFMVGVMKEYSPVKAHTLEILGDFPHDGYPNAVNKLHRWKLNEFDEKLKRLQEFLDEYEPR